MTSDEQRVRTAAGWIGVDISRSRVRTPGKAGYGLYRVRGSIGFLNTYNPDTGQTCGYAAGEWTGYLFTLDMIRICVDDAIRAGTPARPGPLLPRAFGKGWSDPPDATVPTRWTSGYAGRRDLGCGTVNDELAAWDALPRAASLGAELERLERDDPDVARAAAGYERMSEEIRGTVRPKAVREMDALSALVGAGLVQMQHAEGCACEPPDRFTAACVTLTQARAMPRQVQRDANTAFQAAHAPARSAGKASYHARRLSGGQTTGTEET